MKKGKITPCCKYCEFNMPVNNKFICAGRKEHYGKDTPIKNVNYNECFEIAYIYYEEHLEQENSKTKQ